MHTRRDTILAGYPRAANHTPDGDPLGREEIIALFWPETATDDAERLRKRNVCMKWLERSSLPKADGPIVHGFPTWHRATMLAWGKTRGVLNDDRRIELADLRAAANGTSPQPEPVH